MRLEIVNEIRRPLAVQVEGVTTRMRKFLGTLAGLATGQSRLRLPVAPLSEEELAERRRTKAEAQLKGLNERRAKLERRIESVAGRLT